MKALAAVLAAVGCLAWCSPAPAAGQPAAPGALRGGESRIDESAPDEGPASGSQASGPAALPERLRDFVEGSLARYDALKTEAAGFRRQGWYPSLFLRDPARDVEVAAAAGGALDVTAHLFHARRDLEQRLVIAPAERFELPGADKRFFSELLGALAASDPRIAHVRLRFWFGVLRADGQMSWESRGGLGLAAATARQLAAGSRTPEALWRLLDENTLAADVWPAEGAAGR